VPPRTRSTSILSKSRHTTTGLRGKLVKTKKNDLDQTVPLLLRRQAIIYFVLLLLHVKLPVISSSFTLGPERLGKQFPHLARVARLLLSILPSEASSERVFSAMGDIITSKRSTINEDMADIMIFVDRSLRATASTRLRISDYMKQNWHSAYGDPSLYENTDADGNYEAVTLSQLFHADDE